MWSELFEGERPRGLAQRTRMVPAFVVGCVGDSDWSRRDERQLGQDREQRDDQSRRRAQDQGSG